MWKECLLLDGMSSGTFPNTINGNKQGKSNGNLINKERDRNRDPSVIKGGRGKTGKLLQLFI